MVLTRAMKRAAEDGTVAAPPAKKAKVTVTQSTRSSQRAASRAIRDSKTTSATRQGKARDPKLSTAPKQDAQRSIAPGKADSGAQKKATTTRRRKRKAAPATQAQDEVEDRIVKRPKLSTKGPQPRRSQRNAKTKARVSSPARSSDETPREVTKHGINSRAGQQVFRCQELVDMIAESLCDDDWLAAPRNCAQPGRSTCFSAETRRNLKTLSQLNHQGFRAGRRVLFMLYNVNLTREHRKVQYGLPMSLEVVPKFCSQNVSALRLKGDWQCDTLGGALLHPEIAEMDNAQPGDMSSGQDVVEKCKERFKLALQAFERVDHLDLEVSNEVIRETIAALDAQGHQIKDLGILRSGEDDKCLGFLDNMDEEVKARFFNSVENLRVDFYMGNRDPFPLPEVYLEPKQFTRRLEEVMQLCPNLKHLTLSNWQEYEYIFSVPSSKRFAGLVSLTLKNMPSYWSFSALCGVPRYRYLLA